jgi:hypothetical protein
MYFTQKKNKGAVREAAGAEVVFGLCIFSRSQAATEPPGFTNRIPKKSKNDAQINKLMSCIMPNGGAAAWHAATTVVISSSVTAQTLASTTFQVNKHVL